MTQLNLGGTHAALGHVAEASTNQQRFLANAAASLREVGPALRFWMVVGLVCFISDLGIAAAFYAMFRRTNPGMAAFGAFLRVANAVVLCLSFVALFAALRVVSGLPYLGGFDAGQLDSTARLLLGVRTDVMSIAWVLLGFGQAVFAWLLFKTRYVPRLLSGLGVVASLLLAVGPLVIIAAPELRAALGLTYMAPMFLYEVTLGLWLLAVGLRQPR